MGKEALFFFLLPKHELLMVNCHRYWSVWTVKLALIYYLTVKNNYTYKSNILQGLTEA